VRNEPLSDVLKVWLYAAASVLLGAWMSPLLYNAGKALAEVSEHKATNGPLEWLANRCRAADFAGFFEVAILFVAAVLFFPWLEWLARRGQRLRKNPQAVWHFGAGILLAAGLLLSMAVAVAPAGFLTTRPDGLRLVTRSLMAALVMATVMEVFFRGIVLAVFLRAMRPVAALVMSAVLFALALSMMPPAGVDVADPEAARPGFEMLRLLVARFAQPGAVLENFLPLLVLGGVLAYARWRTTSLWLPVGLHAGWWFAKNLLERISPEASHGWLLHGVVPTAAILIAGLLAYFLKPDEPDEA